MSDEITRLLENRKFQRTLTKIAKSSGKSPESINREAKQYLNEIYTRQATIPHLIAIKMAELILGQGYDPLIDVDSEDMRSVTKIMRTHSVAFVMTHKTYIDMFVLAVTLARYGLPIPYIFSGINMSFAGLGQLGRVAGSIFIRRSFKDNEVYKATLRHFITSLVDQQEHFMWAIEGTRSRTGKLVWPKLGILKYIAEASGKSTQKVAFVPVSIVYDLIPDVKEMTQEGRGRDKRPESLAWFIRYVSSMRKNLGRISIRFGTPVNMVDAARDPNVELVESYRPENMALPRLAFEMVYQINEATPVTTTSLVCTTLLSRYSAEKKVIERDVASLMRLIEANNPDGLVDREKSLSEAIQTALNLLLESDIVQKVGTGVQAKYAIRSESYLMAVYYSNMAIHQLVDRAFAELGILGAVEEKPSQRRLKFWEDVMSMRDLFKFEFFYSKKPQFTDEIEGSLRLLDPDWQKALKSRSLSKLRILSEQQILVGQAILSPYVEAYQVVAYTLLEWPKDKVFDQKEFLNECLLLGEKMNWQGKIRRLEAVSKPFLVNGIRLAKNRGLIPPKDSKESRADRKARLALVDEFKLELEDLSNRILKLQALTLEKKQQETAAPVVLEREIVPGSILSSVTDEIMQDEDGPHIGAFFDLDRTLIDRYSALEFLQARFRSGKMTGSEALAQFAGLVVYAASSSNFASLAAIGGRGVKGLPETDFIELGEEVYLKHLAKSIYPEARAMVAAHLAKGHTVAIVSAATPYQVDPIARDLGIEHVMCTRMDVHDGKFTGNLIEPACWGEGKAFYGRKLAEEFNLDLNKSYFYTDSAEDMPLLDIVGKPRPLNPDTRLRAVAFSNEWPIYRFDEEKQAGLSNVTSTGLLLSSLLPAIGGAFLTGTLNLSWRDGVNTMISLMGDLGLAMSGIELVVKGEENLWAERPAVFIFNHQSSADLFIGAKLLRKDITAVAKEELRLTPIGPLLMAADVVFIDRKNHKKAVDALKPAVDALKNGRSIAIAPEGTRSTDKTLGKFKKGAFHLAMQAGVPIVPMVISNASDVMPKGAMLVRPTAVEVKVLPPISTADWSIANLNERVHEVRQLYLDELGQIEIDEEAETASLNGHGHKHSSNGVAQSALAKQK